MLLCFLMGISESELCLVIGHTLFSLFSGKAQPCGQVWGWCWPSVSSQEEGQRARTARSPRNGVLGRRTQCGTREARWQWWLSSRPADLCACSRLPGELNLVPISVIQLRTLRVPCHRCSPWTLAAPNATLTAGMCDPVTRLIISRRVLCQRVTFFISWPTPDWQIIFSKLCLQHNSMINLTLMKPKPQKTRQKQLQVD